MELSQELARAKGVLNQEREVAYSKALDGSNTFEVSEGKEVTMAGGTERVWSLQTAYDSLFTDPDVPETEGAVKQADGSLVMCSKAEWESLFKLMRSKGKDLFIQNETLIAQIDALEATDSFTKIWSTVWVEVI